MTMQLSRNFLAGMSIDVNSEYPTVFQQDLPVNHEVIHLAQISSKHYRSTVSGDKPVYANHWNMELIKRELLTHKKNDLYLYGP